MNTYAEDVLKDITETLSTLLQKTTPDGHTYKDVLSSNGTFSVGNQHIIGQMMSKATQFFHIGGNDLIHNHKYREFILRDVYETNKPWTTHTKINNSNRGIDYQSRTIPSAEFKSHNTKINAKKQLILNENTAIGLIDKVQTRNTTDSKYGGAIENHFMFGLFSEGQLIVSFYINNEDFSKKLTSIVLDAKEKYNQTQQEKTSKGEPKSPPYDAVKITLGDIASLKSFQIFVNPAINVSLFHTLNNASEKTKQLFTQKKIVETQKKTPKTKK